VRLKRRLAAASRARHDARVDVARAIEREVIAGVRRRVRGARSRARAAHVAHRSTTTRVGGCGNGQHKEL
jgi:hypothetical protein